MKKTTQMRVALAIAFTLIAGKVAWAQQSVPAPEGRIRAELPDLVERLAVRVSALANDVGSGLGNSPPGQILARDVQELRQAIGDFQTLLASGRDRFDLRRGYASIDGSWHHLQAELAGTGASSPAIGRDVAQVNELDAKIHELLGLNAYPANFYGQGQAPQGMGEVKRLTHALVDRAEALASLIRTDLPGPQGRLPYEAAVSLVRGVDAFHDGIDLNARRDIAQNGFAGVEVETRQLQEILAMSPTTVGIRRALRSYKSAEVLLRKNLGLPINAEDQAASAIPASGPSPVLGLANQLVAQVDAFVQVFRPTAANVPDGTLILADAERLLKAATDFRNDTTRSLSPGQLAFEFRDVDISWQRLARRTNRIERGRTGPNLQQVETIGQTCASLHQLLGLPGYPPVVAPLAPAR